MSQSIKQVFRRMNLDSDCRSLKPGDHRKLYNGISVQPASSTASLQDLISSVAGNAVVTNADLGAGTNKIIGGLEDRAGNRYFFAVYNATVSFNTIYQYKDGVVTRVMRSDLFAFAATDFVDMDIIGDYLMFTNNVNDIFKINVTKAIAGATYTPTIDQITLIKRPPRGVLIWTPVYEIGYANNYVAGNYFQFFHRYVYEDGERSVFGAASSSCDSWTLPSTTVEILGEYGTSYTLSGNQTIDGRIMSAGERILLKNQTDPKENGIWVSAAGAWARSTDADSDSKLRALNIYVKYGKNGAGQTWKNSNTSAITITVSSIVFSPIDGPNAIDVVTATADFPATVKQVEWAVRVNGGNEYFIYKVEKTPLSGATHRFYNDTFLSTVPDAEAAKWNDSIPRTSKALKVIRNRVFLFNNKEGVTHEATDSINAVVTTVAFSNTRAIRHFKDGGTYKVGLVFFDLSGRFVGGVHCDVSVTIPYRMVPFNILYGQPPYIIQANLGIIAMASIPLTAYNYAVVVSNIMSTSNFYRYLTNDIFYYKVATDGTITYTKTIGSNISGTAIDISTLTSVGLGYTFSKGDRIKIIKVNPLSSVTDPSLFDIFDAKIDSQNGRFVYTKVPLRGLGALWSTSTATVYLFEIYSPKAATIEPLFEVGEKYAVSNPGTGSRAFSTTTIYPTGDVSSVLRPMWHETGPYLQTDPFSNTYEKTYGLPDFYEAMNSYDKNFDKWVKPGARSVVKSSYDTIQKSKLTALRFGQEYDQLSEALQINTFQALDEQTLPIENGPGTGLAVVGEVLVAVHENEATAVYVGQGFVQTTGIGGNSFLAKTEKVIGDARKYLGGHGSIHQASIVQREGAVYWLDARKGVIVRRSQDGITVISEYGVQGGGIQGLVSALCTTHLALGANSRIIAGWDPQYACYVISFIDITSTPTGYTLYWHEKTNAWLCQTDYRPEFWGQLGQNQLAFLSGALWSQTVELNYNKFFGVQYNRKLEWEISTQSLEAIWEAIEVDAEAIYSTAGTNEEIVYLLKADQSGYDNIINYLDFRLRGSAWRSSFFRNRNDASFGSTTESKYKSPHNTRGQSAYLQILYNGTDKNSMKSISVFFRPSLNTTP